MPRGRRGSYAEFTRRYEGHRPSSVKIVDRKVCVGTWREVLLKTCELVRDIKPDEFPQILKLKGPHATWFSRKPTELRNPVRIEGTDIFAEMNANANALVLRSFHVLHHFNLTPKIDVTFEK